MNTFTVETNPLAQDVRFTEDELIVLLVDGRTISVPLTWFPRLLQATKPQLENWEILGDGEGIHWSDLDEDLSVKGLLIGTVKKEIITKELKSVEQQILVPDHLWSRKEILAKNCPVPQEPGIYGWYFRNIPKIVPIDECHRYNNLILLYIGISPGTSVSNNNLRKRIGFHMNQNAEGSTLRRSLGCILSEELDINLCRVGNGKCYTFGKDGESKLSQWMEMNSFVVWAVISEPWKYEKYFINKLKLPLNLKNNPDNEFSTKLKSIRKEQRLKAEELQVLIE